MPHCSTHDTHASSTRGIYSVLDAKEKKLKREKIYFGLTVKTGHGKRRCFKLGENSGVIYNASRSDNSSRSIFFSERSRIIMPVIRRYVIRIFLFLKKIMNNHSVL